MAANQYSVDLTLKSKSKKVGLVQCFHMFDYEEVKRTLVDLKKLGIRGIRTNVSWRDWHSENAQQWFDWLFSTVCQELQLIPCIIYPNTSNALGGILHEFPPGHEDFNEFVEVFITRYGQYFKYVELRLDDAGQWGHGLTTEKDPKIARWLSNVAELGQTLGKKTVLGGVNPFDLNGLRRMFTDGLMQYIDIVGIDCFYGEAVGENWNMEIADIQHVLHEFDSTAKIWITEAGYATWQQTERAQLKEFINVMNTDCERVYWNGLKDGPSEPAFGDYNTDEKRRHLGMKTSNDIPKLLYTVLAARGLERINEYEWMTEPVIGISKNNNDQYTLVTGGAGFVGVNLADKLLMQGKKVLILDNLSREGVANNLFWLRSKYPENLQIMIGDIRDRAAVTAAVQNAVQVFHFAAQVAVTSSLTNPFYDFEVNAQGTLNLLEAIRNSKHQPPVVFASTNKVYGSLDDLGIVMNGTRYHPESSSFSKHGISEKRNLDFHSPYGCTKGVADQYMIDYSRTFGIKTAVFRMSCIYGPHQFGTEDQGWVAHFLIQALKNQPIMLYGDGKQVRDILFVEDLVDAYILAMENIDSISGNAFNMGGGVRNTISLLELCDIIGDITGKKPDVKFSGWRPGDQKFYVSDFSKFSSVTGWKPRTNVREGVQCLYNWLKENAGVHHIANAPKSGITNAV